LLMSGQYFLARIFKEFFFFKLHHRGCLACTVYRSTEKHTNSLVIESLTQRPTVTDNTQVCLSSNSSYLNKRLHTSLELFFV
jgi:hypothetical protein